MFAFLLEPFRDLSKVFKKHPVASATILALIIRFPDVETADFPINDGGLFYTMTKELKDSNFKLPLFTSYNNANIPFSYPPLAFFVSAVFSSLFSIPLITIFRFLPLIVSLLSVPAFYLLAKNLIGKDKAVLTTFVFVLLPKSFVWIIMGAV